MLHYFEEKNSLKTLFLLWTVPFPHFSFFPLMKLRTYFYSIPSFLEKYFHQHAGHRTDFDRPREIESTLSLSIPTSTQCTMDIFCSKSGHLSNRIIVRFLFIFSKKIAVVFDHFSKWRVLAEVGKNHQM